MSAIQIFTDSTCDLTPELLDRHGIRIIPLYVVFGSESVRDGIGLSIGQLFAKVKETEALPKTAAPSITDFAEAFEPYVRQGKKVLYIGISSNLSSTYQNAVIAAKEFPEGTVEVVDSRNLSTGIGLTVLKAAEYAERGMNDPAVLADRLRRDVKRVETEFVIDTLDYLHKGGRCTGTQLVVGSLLRIHPVIKVADGSMIVAEKLRGKMDKVVQSLLERVLAHKDNIDPEHLFITHSLAAESAGWLKERLEEELNVKQVHVTEAGCVISSHCGPGTVGVIYMKRQE